MNDVNMSRIERIRAHVEAALQPEHIVLDDQSAQHAGTRSESHFKLVVVASCFEGLTQVKRHQMVYQPLQAEFDSGLHALALHTFSPKEWATNERDFETPPCTKSP